MFESSQEFLLHRTIVTSIIRSLLNFKYSQNTHSNLELMKRFSLLFFSLFKTYNSDFEIFLDCCRGFLKIFSDLQNLVSNYMPQFLYLFSTLASFAISDHIENTTETLTVLVGNNSKNFSSEMTETTIESNTERNVHFILSLLVTTNVQEILIVKLGELVQICFKQIDESQKNKEESDGIILSVEDQMKLILDLLIQILQIEMGKAIFPKMLVNARGKDNGTFDFDFTMKYILNVTKNSDLILKAVSLLVVLEADCQLDYLDDVYSPSLKESLKNLLQELEGTKFDKTIKQKIMMLFSVLPVEELSLIHI